MPIYTEPDEPDFARREAAHGWFPAVLLAEYGEQDGAPTDADIPAALNWLTLLPIETRYDFEEAECGMVYVSSAYACSVWDVSGEEDVPWAVFVVDDFGARFLPEYSILDDEAGDEEIEEKLRRASEELPARMEKGEFVRTGTPLVIPPWLHEARPTSEEE